MFKGNLIEDQNYYRLRSKHLLYFLLPSLAIGLLVNFYHLPIWVTIGAVVFYAGVVFLSSKNLKEMFKVANKRIEIDKNTIALKEANGRIIETIKIDKDTKLIVKKDYMLSQETMKNIQEELKGNTEKHFLIVERNTSKRRFDFVIESYYMLSQLKKIVQSWQKENLRIEYVD